MALLGVQKTLWITFPPSERDKVVLAMEESITDMDTLKKFAEDFTEGRLDRKQMKKRLSEIEGLSLFDKTKAKMFVNASKYIHKIGDKKLVKRIGVLRSVVEMMEGFLLMNITYEHRHTSALSGICVVLSQVGAERANYIRLFEKLFLKHRVNDYNVYTNKKESGLGGEMK